MRTRAERRHTDWSKAIRKKKITEQYPAFNEEHPWYNNLHSYSKNKIPCSCPYCRSKTNDKRVVGPSMNWPMSDRRKIDRMNQAEEELFSNNKEMFREMGDGQ